MVDSLTTMAAAQEAGGDTRDGRGPDLDLRGDALRRRLAGLYAEITGEPVPSDDEPLFLGSLEATELRARIESELAMPLVLDDLFGEITIETLAERALARPDDGGPGAGAPMLEADRSRENDPFPLTDIQQAYLLGRSGVFDLGDVSTHLYLEFEHENLDVERLTGALRRLIERHGMLRAVVDPDGYQRILPGVQPYEIELTDLRSLSPVDTADRLDRVREQMSHEVRPCDQWPLFEVRAHRLDETRYRLHLSIDLLIADGASIGILLRECSLLYRDPGAALPPLELSFRDYVQVADELRSTDRYSAARDYWLGRLSEIPAAPELPFAAPRDTTARFMRRARAFDADVWTRLRQRARQSGLTPSALLCAAYAEVLAAWSKQPRFTINVTLGERIPMHPHVSDLIGDFTSSVLLAVDASGGAGFDELAARLQQRLHADLEHGSFGGVEVLRELARAGGEGVPSMPVVFTSLLGIGLSEPGTLEPFERTVHAVSQTPQVLLDNQVVERAGGIEVSWDAVEDRFLPGVLDAMFEAYCWLLERLAAGDHVDGRGSLLPIEQLRQRAEVNATEWDQPERLLHRPIERWVRERPHAPAVISAKRTLTYAELDQLANQVARQLLAHGVERNQLVGVVMEKGWAQVVAVLGVLRAGAAYLPIDANLPASRLHHLLEQADSRLALTQAGVNGRIDWPGNVTRIEVDGFLPADGSPVDGGAGPEDLAYVIFTSGSTGLPKGVMIEHRSATNTVLDINTRFGVGPRDRVLAVSSLSFDLSVYDVFGMLSAGGTVVVPDAGRERDPASWAAMVREHRITVWNSVPALLGLVADYAAGQQRVIGDKLRLAMLSGDWVPLDLPDRVRALAPGIQVVSLGGATEGSIWSILYPIESVDPGWTSIPYGYPMWNQQMHVLDDDLEPRPVWVPGEIVIGGAGVAAGYWRDPQRSAERFVRQPGSGEILYRTGDLGRYLPDGAIEFLGREDFQVKIRGHRVELGEIEAVLAEHPLVRTVVVVAAGERTGQKRLVAHYVPTLEQCPAESDLRDFAAQRLPHYMVPSAFVAHQALPLTANGKVNRSALAEPSIAVGPQSCSAAAPHTTVQQLGQIWRTVLGVERVDPDDDFFHSGGDSLLALRFIAHAGAAGMRLRPDDFFAGATLRALASRAQADAPPPAEQGIVTGAVTLTPTQKWFLEHDFEERNHWNGMWPLLSVGDRLDPALLGAAIHRLLIHHDALRTRFTRTEAGWTATVQDPEAALPVPFSAVDLSATPDSDLDHVVEGICARAQASLDIERGPVIRFTYLDLGPDRPGRLHVAAHWSTLDYYSARILFEDLQATYAQLRRGLDPTLPAKTTSVVEAGGRIAERARAAVGPGELGYWLDPRRVEAAAIPVERHGVNVQGSARRVLVALGPEETEAITTQLPRRYGCEVREVILLALTRAVSGWTGRDSLVIDVEGHGREDLAEDVDISRTIGRFTTIWPLLLQTPARSEPAEAVAEVMRQVRRPLQRGVWHGMLRHLRGDADLRRQLDELPPAAIGFNYWGQVDEFFTDQIWPSAESPGPHRSGTGHRPRALDVLGWVAGGELALVWSYSENLHSEATVQRLAERTVAELRALAGQGSDPTSEPASGAVTIDEHRPLQLDGQWRLSGLAHRRSDR